MTEGRSGQRLRVLLPLCGASLDLAWLQRQRHTVVGVEGVRKVVEKLLRYANMSTRAQRLPLGSSSSALKTPAPLFFFTEFFNISARVIGTFDAVFNRFLTTSFSLLFIH